MSDKLDILAKFLLKKLINIFYDVKVFGLNNVPEKGPNILIVNHQSYLDAPALFSLIKRDIKFLAYYKLFETKVIGKFLKLHHDIPIKDKDIAEINRAFEQCRGVLNNNQLLCIFPEGNLTPDGEIKAFKHGIKHLWTLCPNQIIPIAIHGFWDTAFSRNHIHKISIHNIFKRKKLWVNIGQPIGFSQIPDPNFLRQIILGLHSELLKQESKKL